MGREGSCKKSVSSDQERVGTLAHLMPPQMIRTSDMINASVPVTLACGVDPVFRKRCLPSARLWLDLP